MHADGVALIVEPDRVARMLGIPLPLDQHAQWIIEQAIRDAQDDVEAYLGRPITVREFTEGGRRRYEGRWLLSQSPVVEVLSAVLDPDGDDGWPDTYTVTYRAGLDAVSDPALGPIRRYVQAAAMYAPTVQTLLRQLNPDAARKVTSLSVEGQSVTFTDVYDTSKVRAGDGAPGSVPTLASLDRWRVAGRRVYQRPGPTRDDRCCDSFYQWWPW